MEWHLTKNELPKENVYVLIHIPNEPWEAGTSTVFYDIAKVVKGISEEEREKLDDSNPRKTTYCFGDVFGNNLVPYQWETFGPATYFGQEVVAWAYIDEFKGEE